MLRRLAVLALCLAPAPVAAHPHIFIDTGVELIFQDGAPVAVRVTWDYDDFFSMMMIEDRQLDRDGDGVLTPEEEASLTGFDMDWDPDFAGDTYVLVGETEVALARPTEWTARYVDGRITSTHLRRFETPVPAGQVVTVQTYDPGYYTAYSIAWAPRLTGADPACKATVFSPDIAQADAILQKAIQEMQGTDSLEADFPAVGSAYAEEVRIECPAS